MGSIIFLISKFLGDISFLVFLFSRLLFQRLLLLNCYFADVLIRTCYYCGSERMMLSKSCTQYVRGSGRPSSGHRTRKGQSSSQFPRRVVLKNVLTIGLRKGIGFRKGRETRGQIANIGSSKKQESSRKTSTFALLTMPNPLTVWITTNCGRFFKRWKYQTT